MIEPMVAMIQDEMNKHKPPPASQAGSICQWGDSKATDDDLSIQDHLREWWNKNEYLAWDLMRSAKSKLNHDSMNKLFKITNITGRESMKNYPCSDKWWKLNHDDMSELFRITNITGRGSMKNFPAQMNDEINHD